MIRKITRTQYLKGWQAMTAQEREDYRTRVGEWLRSDGERLLEVTDRPMAQAQNVMMMSARWSGEDCRAFQDGALLMSALAEVTDTWLPVVLYSKSAWRATRKLVESLSLTLPHREGTAGATRTLQTKTQGTVKAQTNNTAGKPQDARPEAKAQAAKPTITHNPSPITPHPSPITPAAAGGIPVRPKHIDQYVHLLPKGTQERAGQVRELLRELDHAREQARLLMTDTKASAASRAAWAKKATKTDEQAGRIYKELDAEWAKLVSEGRVTVDALGQAHVVPLPQNGKAQDMAPSGKPTDTDGEPRKRGRKPLTEEQKKAKAAARAEKLRREAVRKAGLLRKFLIDTRNAKTEEQKVKWMAKYKEMVAIGGEKAVTEKVREAAVYYGVELNS